MSDIVFKGKTIKPDKSGFYRCQFACGNQRYPRKKCKTQKGFIAHLESCPNSPDKLEARKAREENNTKEQEKLALSEIEKSGVKVGDQIIFVYEIITKSTHDSRGRRVRYEPEKYRSVFSGCVQSVDWRGALIVNGKLVESVFKSIGDANDYAEKQDAAHKKYLEFCSFCR